MNAAPVRRAPKRDAQRPPDSRASLRGALRQPCREASSPVGVARSGGNSQCRRAGGLWAASATQSGRRPWAHRGMDEKSGRPYTSAATRPMRATLTRAPCSPSASTRATSRFGRPVTHAPCGRHRLQLQSRTPRLAFRGTALCCQMTTPHLLVALAIAVPRLGGSIRAKPRFRAAQKSPGPAAPG